MSFARPYIYQSCLVLGGFSSNFLVFSTQKLTFNGNLVRDIVDTRAKRNGTMHEQVNSTDQLFGSLTEPGKKRNNE